MRKYYILILGALFCALSCQKTNKKSPEPQTPTAIQLNKPDITLNKGAKEVLSVIFTPTNASSSDLNWSSSKPEIATVENGTVTGIAPGEAVITVKCGSLTAKCDVSVVVPVTKLTLDSDFTIERGKESTLTLTVTPSDATDEIKWSSSNEKVATVNEGKVSAIKVGTTTITATAGNQKAECKVEVHIPGAVDLGLSVYWATENLRAFNGQETYPNGLYAWGETNVKLKPNGTYQDYSWDNYTLSNGDKLTRYCATAHTSQWYPTTPPDNKLSLDMADDAARAKLGDKWRIPTKNEMQDLIDKCEWTWKNNGYTNGYEVTSKTTGKSIFLPAGGYLEAGIISPYTGYYWSTELGTVKSTWGSCLNFTDTEKKIGEFVRYVGCYIRPVTE